MSFHSLHIAGTALRTSQLQADIAGRNLAGANKPGYSRQTAILADLGPGLSTFQRHADGVGVIVERFQRVRDGLLDQAYRMHHRQAEGARALEPLATRLESTLGQTESLAEVAQEARLTLLEVASHPEDPAIRADLMGKLEGLTERFRTTRSHMVDIQEEAVQRTDDALGRANEILDQLGELNQHLVATSGSSGRNALLDRRDQLLDELSGFAEIRTVEQRGDGVAVYLDGRQLVFGNEVTHLELDSSGQMQTELGAPVQAREGSIASFLNFRNSTVPGELAELDNLALQLHDQLNEIHRIGYGLDGVAGRDLLSGTGAGDLRLAITAPEEVAAAASHMEGTASIHSGTFSSGQSLSSQAANLSLGPAASGSIEVNGTAISWSDSDSLSDILSQFSAAGVTAGYDSTSGKVLLERDPSVAGPPDITVTDLSGNLSQVLQLDTATSSPAIPGDGKVARALVERLDSDTFGAGSNQSFEEGLSAQRTRAGTFLRKVYDDTARHELLETDAETNRSQSYGVSTDEELLQLERFQQSYAAAARIATVADEMMSTLMNMGRG